MKPQNKFRDSLPAKLPPASLFLSRHSLRSAFGLAAFAVATGLFTARDAAADTLTFNPTKDATVKAKYPTSNWGTDTVIVVSNQTGFQKHIFTQFTVSGIPSGSTNIVTKLHLNSQTTGTGRSISAHTVSSTSWTETGITWNNQPALGATLSTVSSFTSGSDGVWDVSGQVTGNGTYAIGLDGTYSGDTDFVSRESSPQPSLVVTYTPPATGITVQQGNLALDGTLWLPKGFIVVGLVAPSSLRTGIFKIAHDHWGQTELNAAKDPNKWHADLIRFNVSVCALDPNDSIYNKDGYINEVVTAVDLARSNGFKVILTMQHESPSGCTHVQKMPSTSAERAWQTLAPYFNSDPYVMYELFNEPDAPDGSMTPNQADWLAWKNGLSGNDSDGNAYVGHQDLITTIRATSPTSTNLLLADGLRQARTFGTDTGGLLTDYLGSPPLTDPTSNKLAYAVHTFFNGSANRTPTQWVAHWGAFHAAGYAILGTAWDASPSHNGCTSTQPADAANIIQYMRSGISGYVGGGNMGNEMWAFDVPDTFTLDDPTGVLTWTWTPNAFSTGVPYDCNSTAAATDGAGVLVQQDYQQH